MIDAAAGVVGSIAALLSTFTLKTIYTLQSTDARALSVLDIIRSACACAGVGGDSFPPLRPPVPT